VSEVFILLHGMAQAGYDLTVPTARRPSQDFWPWPWPWPWFSPKPFTSCLRDMD